jgi:hypothetical protein
VSVLALHVCVCSSLLGVGGFNWLQGRLRVCVWLILRVILLCPCPPVFRSVGCCRDVGYLLISLYAAAQIRLCSSLLASFCRRCVATVDSSRGGCSLDDSETHDSSWQKPKWCEASLRVVSDMLEPLASGGVDPCCWHVPVF